MPIKLSASINIKSALESIGQLQKDTQHAQRTTVTQVAANGRSQITSALQSNLDNPVPWIAKAYRFEKATDLKNPVARILVTDSKRLDYIISIIDSGQHITSRLTDKARRQGTIKRSESLVPTRRLKLNARGNLTKRSADRLLNEGVFVRGKKAGIYIQKGKKFTKVLTPSRVSPYKPLVDPVKILQREAANFGPLYQKALQKNISRSISKRLR